MNQIVFFAEVLCVAFVLWLGIFVVSRDFAVENRSLWQRSALLAGIATILLGFYFLGVAMQTISETGQEFIRWQKITWWVVPGAVVLFFRSVVLITEKESTLAHRLLQARTLWSGTSIYAVLLTIGSLSEFFIDNRQVQAVQGNFEAFYAPVRLPQFYFYDLFLALLLSASVYLLLRCSWLAYRQDKHEFQKFRWLGYGSLGLIIGTLIGAVIHPLSDGLIPKQLGDLVLTLGAAAVSFGVARYNALGHDQIVEQDFWHSLLNVAATTFFYLALFHATCWLLGYPRPTIVTPILVVLAVITQTPRRLLDGIVDKLLLPNWLSSYRQQLSHISQDLLTTPKPEATLETAVDTFQQIVVEVQQKELEELIRGEVESIFQYTRLQDNAHLAASDLFRLRLLQTRIHEQCQRWGIAPSTISDDQRSEILRSILLVMIEERYISLFSIHPTSLSDEQIEILILKKKYVEQLTRNEVERFLNQNYQIIVSGGAYSRHLANGRLRLAQKLHSLELTFNRPPQ